MCCQEKLQINHFYKNHGVFHTLSHTYIQLSNSDYSLMNYFNHYGIWKKWILETSENINLLLLGIDYLDYYSFSIQPNSKCKFIVRGKTMANDSLHRITKTLINRAISMPFLKLKLWFDSCLFSPFVNFTFLHIVKGNWIFFRKLKSHFTELVVKSRDW